ELLAERYRQRQSDIPETDHGNCGHTLLPSLKACNFRRNPEEPSNPPAGSLQSVACQQLSSVAEGRRQRAPDAPNLSIPPAFVPQRGLDKRERLAGQQSHDIVIRLLAARGKARSRKELMSWITWVAILVGWPMLGLAVAYLFGRFTHRGEAYG